MSNTALAVLVEETRDRYKLAEMRKGFVERDATIESVLRRIAWQADMDVAGQAVHKQVWWGLALFAGHRIGMRYQWTEPDPDAEPYPV